MADDGGNEWKYTVITYYPGAKFTVVKADMSDATYTADGNSHPQWGILLDLGTGEQRYWVDPTFCRNLQ